MSRNTQGVKLIALQGTEKLVGVEKIEGMGEIKAMATWRGMTTAWRRMRKALPAEKLNERSG